MYYGNALVIVLNIRTPSNFNAFVISIDVNDGIYCYVSASTNVIEVHVVDFEEPLRLDELVPNEIDVVFIRDITDRLVLRFVRPRKLLSASCSSTALVVEQQKF